MPPSGEVDEDRGEKAASPPWVEDGGSGGGSLAPWAGQSHRQAEGAAPRAQLSHPQSQIGHLPCSLGMSGATLDLRPSS